MKNATSRAIGIALLALNLPACETIKSFFPDKQQDYRYSTEIPPLELPPRLKSDAIKLEDDLRPPVAPQTNTTISEAPATAAPTEAPAPEPQNAPQRLVAWADGNSRLVINEPYDKAWLIVTKALTHKAVEITDRDRSQGVFFVQYDPEKYEVRDGSVWDEVAFFFGSRDSHELPYRVRVIENGAQTQVAVTEENDAPVTQGPGVNLLQLLFDTIAADAEGKPASESEETQKTESEEASKSGDEQQNPEAEPKPPAADENKQQ